MKLYYSPGASSLAPHIALKESGLAFAAIAAPTKTHKLADGTDYYSINPLGYVPYLVLDDGRTLHEGPAIVQYIADQVPDKQLAPPNGTWERYKLQEWLNLMSTELHKGGFAPLFAPGMPTEVKDTAKTRLISRLAWIDGELAGKTYLVGDRYSVADAYLFVVAGWGKHVGVKISGMANLSALMARVAERPAVQETLRAEGLIK